MPGIKHRRSVRSKGPRPVSPALSLICQTLISHYKKTTKKDLIERFDKLMRNNKGGIVDFPLRYIEDHALNDSLEALRTNCDGMITDEELYKGAQLAKGLLDPVTHSSRSPKLMYHSGAFTRCW